MNLRNKSNIKECFMFFSLGSKKKGDFKWDIVVILILGLIVVGIVLYFIFGEYFSEDVVDVENCRQSVVLRGTMPEVNSGSITWKSLKDDFPLKCKTQVITIGYEDVAKAEKEVADTIAGCWNLYGEGGYNIFASAKFGFNSVCVPCARIHLSPDVKEFYVDENLIDIPRGLSGKFRSGSYLDYLMKDAIPFPALAFGEREFDLQGGSFEVFDDDIKETIIKNRLTGEIERGGVGKIELPKYLYPENGDLIVNFGTATTSFTGGIGNYLPYIFYYQTDSKIIPNEQFGKMIIDGPAFSNGELCNNWEGIPA